MEVELEGNLDRIAVENNVRALNKSEFLAAIERVCDRLAGPDALVEIDRLEIDLPAIQPNQLTSDWAVEFEQVFKNALSKKVASSVSKRTQSGVDERSMPTGKRQLLEYFLSSGVLPWWAPEAERETLRQTFAELLSQPDAHVAAVLNRGLDDPSFRKRLVRQFPAQVLAAVRAVLFGDEARASTAISIAQVEKWHQQLKRWVHATEVLASYPAWPEVLWEAELELAADKGKTAPAQLLATSALRLIENRYPLLIDALVKALPINLAGGAKPPLKKALLAACEVVVDRRTKAADEKQTKQAEPKTTDQSTEETTKAAPRQQVPPEAEKSPSGPKDLSNTPANAPQDQAAPADLPPEAEQGPAQQATDPAERARPPKAEQDADLAEKLAKYIAKPAQSWPGNRGPKWRLSAFAGEELFIENAGLVLLWPYYTRFFQALEISNADGFLSEDDASKGVYYLQYLATGRDTWPEFDLTLNKLLCGLDPLDPISDAVRLTDREKKHADDLIKTVISHWPAIGEMSIEGFRGSFMLRDARLRSKDRAWELRADQKTWDILMQKLPWSYSIVRLKWMEHPIHVEW